MKSFFLTIFNKLPIDIYLACRRLLPKSDSPGLNLLPRLAFISITLGVAASILILSLANGLHEHYLSRLAEADSHISVISIGRGIPNYQEVMQKISLYKGVEYVYPYAQKEVLLQSYGETTGLVIKAYPNAFSQDTTFNQYFQLQNGEWSFDKPRTLTIGRALARDFSLSVGDFVDILSYDEDFGTITYRFKISGIFSASDSLIDKGIGFISFNEYVELFGQEGYSPNIGMRIKDYKKPEGIAQQIRNDLPLSVTTWKLSNLNTLAALQNEKQIIRVLLIIFFCVTFFGILAVMTALVADKREEIALLKTLGMTSKESVSSFLWTGLLLGISASLIGAITGIILSINFNRIIKIIEIIINQSVYYISLIIRQDIDFQFSVLNQNVYYLKEFPILIQVGDIAFSIVAAVLCTLVAAIYPSLISKDVKAAEILRKRAF